MSTPAQSHQRPTVRSVDEQAQYQWTLEEVQSEEVSKKQLIEYLMERMPEPLKLKHKIKVNTKYAETFTTLAAKLMWFEIFDYLPVIYLL